jgi:hypothetical protein
MRPRYRLFTSIHGNINVHNCSTANDNNIANDDMVSISISMTTAAVASYLNAQEGSTLTSSHIPTVTAYDWGILVYRP